MNRRRLRICLCKGRSCGNRRPRKGRFWLCAFKRERKKRALCLLLAAALFCALAVPLAPPAAAEGLDVPAPAAVLMEFSTGEVLFEKNPHEVRPCASITKVMTLLLVFEAIDSGALHYDDMLTASAHAAGMGGSDIWLKEGEQMTVDDLIKACVVMSANDAAVVLAEAVAGTEEAFVERMNARGGGSAWRRPCLKTATASTRTATSERLRCGRDEPRFDAARKDLRLHADLDRLRARRGDTARQHEQARPLLQRHQGP